MEGNEETPIINSDGTFTENWREQIFSGDEDADFRENLTLANCKDIRTMSKRLIDSQSQIGKLTSGRDFAILPNEHSTPEEIAEFHTKLGRPATPQDYDFDKIEGANPKFVEKMSAALHTAGAPKTVAEAAAKAYLEFQTEHEKEQETEAKIADAKGDKAVRDLFGSAYDQKMSNINLAITSLAAPIDADYAKQLAEDVKYDPQAAQFLEKIGNMISEDPGLQNATGSAAFSPADALAKADEIRNTNPYWATDTPVGHPRNPQKHEEALAEVDALMRMAYPNK